ncbi:hypothetical protein PO878_06260 [Iamia majanohamensis]|uniref:Agenet domain-containing protein n=1 Tax=Iamia majanohamensis TaxID=467976 RepID=A0AAE9Y7E1_9ACTN|nr:hypothetical protein [Iamia majanohamensis]WCO68330.1 hypothetical protein PO878_06260 [Iamia majanohamensis]
MAEERSGARELAPGTRVEVRDGFEGHWNRGFVVESVTDEGYSVRRTSDDTVLARPLPRAAVRRERRGSMWWM